MGNVSGISFSTQLVSFSGVFYTQMAHACCCEKNITVSFIIGITSSLGMCQATVAETVE